MNDFNISLVAPSYLGAAYVADLEKWAQEPVLSLAPIERISRMCQSVQITLHGPHGQSATWLGGDIVRSDGWWIAAGQGVPDLTLWGRPYNQPGFWA